MVSVAAIAMIAPVTVSMIAIAIAIVIVLDAAVSAVVAVSVSVVVRRHNAATEQSRGSGKQYKNDPHNDLHSSFVSSRIRTGASVECRKEGLPSRFNSYSEIRV